MESMIKKPRKRTDIRVCPTKNKIKFSHQYLKMPYTMPFKAVLICCCKAEYKDLPKTFLDYDTAYDGGHYPLPKGRLIVLFMYSKKEGDECKQFTTIRRYTPKKWEYYEKLEGEEFEIVKV